MAPETWKLYKRLTKGMATNTMYRVKMTISKISSLIAVSIPFLVLILVNGCQFPYEATIDEKVGILSIDGSIVKGESIQTITISRSTSFYAPEFELVSDCEVLVIDELGTEFMFTETSVGVYTRHITDDQLVYDRNYKARISTPEGKVYESHFETILRGAPVDSVYFESDIKNSGFENEVSGLQFYIDIVGDESDSKYYRWKLTETWQYNSLAVVEYIYLNKYFDTAYPDSYMDFFTCWNTLLLPGLYSASTVNLVDNTIKKVPLHFVPPNTGRISIKYSLLIEQYSLTTAAYEYWNRTRIETEESSGLYSQQPGQIQSNVFNVNDEDEEVLGYFWAATKSEKRIFLFPQPGLTEIDPNCQMIVLDKYAIERFPVYVFTDDFGNEFSAVNQTCMNCLLLGGVSEKPDFWD